MRNKINIARDYVLGKLENGELSAGDQIPSARDIAVELGISFLKVQQAMESLCRDGVLESYPRKGLFVQEAWNLRVLPENLSVYNRLHRLPWLKDMLEVAQGELSEIRMTHAFKMGMLELKVSRHVLTEHNDYMDLRGIFHECYPDHSVFFEKMFKAFEVNGRVIGIPFAVSPRVVFYNPQVFREAGCRLPRPGWDWEEFLEDIRRLKKTLPANRILNWHTQSFLWMNFVLRAGGNLFDPALEDPVLVDSAKTLRGLRCFSEMGDLVERAPHDSDAYLQDFIAGKAAMIIGDRKEVDFFRRAGYDAWAVTPLPQLPEGVDVTAQATDLVCVRKACTSRRMAVRYVRMMLSESVQEYMGRQKCCIPIRKDAAYRSLDLTDPRDSVFAAEMGKMTTDFHLTSPFPATLVLNGISLLLERNLDLQAGLAELAQVARTVVSVNGTQPCSCPKSVFGKAAP